MDEMTSKTINCFLPYAGLDEIKATVKCLQECKNVGKIYLLQIGDNAEVLPEGCE